MEFLLSVYDIDDQRIENQFALVLIDEQQHEVLKRRCALYTFLSERPEEMIFNADLFYLTEDPDPNHIVERLDSSQRAILKTYGTVYIDDKFPTNEQIPCDAVFREKLHVCNPQVYWSCAYNGQFRRTKRVMLAYIKKVHAALELNKLMDRAMFACHEAHGGLLPEELRSKIKIHREMLRNTSWVDGEAVKEYLHTAYLALEEASRTMGAHSLWYEGGQGFAALKAMERVLARDDRQ